MGAAVNPMSSLRSIPARYTPHENPAGSGHCPQHGHKLVTANRYGSQIAVLRHRYPPVQISGKHVPATVTDILKNYHVPSRFEQLPESPKDTFLLLIWQVLENCDRHDEVEMLRRKTHRQ